MREEQPRIKVMCPYCGHGINVFYQAGATCKGVFLRCKNNACKKIFELRL